MKKSNRKLLLEIQHEITKLRVGLNTLRQSPQSPRTAAVWTHLANITQGSEELCKACKMTQFTSFVTTLRSITECAINCSLTISYYSDEAFFLPELNEKLKFNNKIIHDSTGQFSRQNKEVAKDNKITIQERIKSIESNPDLKIPSDISIEEKFRIAGQEEFYKLHYTVFSAAVHSSPTELGKRHVIIKDDQPQLTWHLADSTEINIYLICFQDIISYSTKLLTELTSMINTLTNTEAA